MRSPRLAVVPSFERDFEPGGRAELTRSVLVVKGLKCVDTAERVIVQLEGVKGVKRFVAFASQHRAEVSFSRAMVARSAGAAGRPCESNGSMSLKEKG